MTDEPPTPKPLEGNSDRWPSIDLVYEELKWRVENQQGQVSALDTKSNFGLASSTLVLAALAVFGNETVAKNSGADRIELILIGISLASYGAVLLSWHQAFKLRKYALSPDPKRLSEVWVHNDPQELKGVLITTRVNDIAENDRILSDRSLWIKVESYSFIVLIVTIVIVLIVQ